MIPFPRRPAAYTDLVATHFDWLAWERLLATRGVVVERPANSAHPEYPSIVYPIDYGYVDATVGTDGDPVDVFVGSGSTGLAGLLLTTDFRRGDREAKLLWNCTPPEIYTAHGFVNFDRTLLEGLLVLRRPMHTLWADVS